MAKTLDKLTDEALLDLVDRTGAFQVALLCKVTETAVLARLADIERKLKRAQAITGILRSRPMPPVELIDVSQADDIEEYALGVSVPAPEIGEWAKAAIVGDGVLYNADHDHLIDANIGFLWTNVEQMHQGLRVVGRCELPTIQGNTWAKSRYEQLLRQWFGREPLDFIITFDAFYMADASNEEFCSTLEHEFYHAGQCRDEFGDPKWRRDGRPKFAVVGHEYELFHGQAERYGFAASGAGRLEGLLGKAPTVAKVKIDAACGTCLRL